MNDAFKNEIETAITNATPSVGPFSIYDGGAYRFTSANHDDKAARLEIMDHAVKRAWGEYKVQRER